MPKLQAGMRAPAFTLRDSAGRGYSLVDALKKGPLLAAFFKVGCPVCQFTFPFLQRLYDSYGDSSVSFWGISQDNAADTQEFLNEFGVKFPSLLDADGYRVSKQYGLTNVPSLFLIRPDSTLHTASVGFAKNDIEAIAAEVAKAAGKPAQPVFLPGEQVPEYRPG